MSEVAFGMWVSVAGILCLAVFVFLNMVLQPKWENRSAPGADRSAVVLLGLVEAAVFFAGVALLTAGSTIIGTAIGYT